MRVKAPSTTVAVLHLALLLACNTWQGGVVNAQKVDAHRDDKAMLEAGKVDEGYDLLVPVSESERQKICAKCPDCLMCSSGAGLADDSIPISGAGSKFEIHWTDLDPVEENRRKRIVDLTRPARYHCGKCPTCYCYYRAWRG